MFNLKKSDIPVSMRPAIGEIGVIVGRFQSSYLHEGYKTLINFVKSRHPRVFVFLQTPLTRGTANDPLPFQTRRAMIEKEYPDLEVFKLNDIQDTDRWSQSLDKEIDLLAGPTQEITIYGGKECFTYTGKYVFEDTSEIKNYYPNISSSEIRKQIGISCQNDTKWREGVIWMSQNRFPIIYPTVDIAAINLSERKVLLGRKSNSSLWRFPGGFAEKTNDSYESDAFRELQEECSIDAKSIDYIGSTIINDPRYKNGEDRIKTLFYAVTDWSGEPKAADDLEEVKWFSLEELEGHAKDEFIVPSHRILVVMLLNWYFKLMAKIEEIKKKTS